MIENKEKLLRQTADGSRVKGLVKIAVVSFPIFVLLSPRFELMPDDGVFVDVIVVVGAAVSGSNHHHR